MPEKQLQEILFHTTKNHRAAHVQAQTPELSLAHVWILVSWRPSKLWGSQESLPASSRPSGAGSLARPGGAWLPTLWQ